MMRFTVDARAFSDAMSKVSKVLRKNPIPILEEIAVCIQNGRCTLTATDLETWLVAELPARGDDMSFVFSRTKDVMKACAHFEGELAITFVPKDEKDGKIEVLCEQRAAEFSTASYEDYPECGTVEEGASLRVNAAALFHRIERVRLRPSWSRQRGAAILRWCCRFDSVMKWQPETKKKMGDMPSKRKRRQAI